MVSYRDRNLISIQPSLELGLLIARALQDFCAIAARAAYKSNQERAWGGGGCANAHCTVHRVPSTASARDWRPSAPERDITPTSC